MCEKAVVIRREGSSVRQWRIISSSTRLRSGPGAVSFDTLHMMTAQRFLSLAIISVTMRLALGSVPGSEKAIFCHKGTSSQSMIPIRSAIRTISSLAG